MVIVAPSPLILIDSGASLQWGDPTKMAATQDYFPARHEASTYIMSTSGALPKSWYMLVKMCPWWPGWFLLHIWCHMTLSYRGLGFGRLQSRWAVALQVLWESRPTFMTSGLCPNWLLSTLTCMTCVSMNFQIHKHLFSTQTSHTVR